MNKAKDVYCADCNANLSEYADSVGLDLVGSNGVAVAYLTNYPDKTFYVCHCCEAEHENS